MSWQTYDDFGRGELDASLWEPLSIGPVERLEPGATTTASDGVLTIEIPEFTNADSEHQLFDNTKHVIFSRRGFDLPERGTARFAMDLAVHQVGSELDYRLGVASVNVVDTEGSTHMVFDILGHGNRFFAEHEVLALPGEENPFTRVVDAPLTDWGSGEFHSCVIEIDTAGRRATWSVDEIVVTEVLGLEVLPGSVRIGLGFFTLLPVGPGVTSCRGQGGRASWRNVRYSLEG